MMMKRMMAGPHPGFKGVKRMAGPHPGFKAVAAKIQRKYPGEPGAGARIAAAAARGASAAAKRKNPSLKRVRGK